MALITDIADAVVTELAAGSFSLPFTPERRVLPVFDLPDLKGLHVTVVPRGVEIAGASRSMSTHDVRIDIGIQKKLGTDLDAEVAELCGLADEIAAYLHRRRLADVPTASWVRTANEPVYAPEHLAEKRLFTGVLTLTYRVVK